MTEYPKDADPATKLFWENMMANVRNSTSKRILIAVEKIEQKTGLIEGVSRALASVFKVGANDVEKVYPSKKR
jgi:hypothetical protein